LAYIAALSYAAIKIYNSIDEYHGLAEQEFFNLADLSAAAGVLGFMDEPFREAVMDGLIKSRTLEGVIISGPNGEYAFEREPGAVIAWSGDVPRFKTRIGLSVDPYHVPLRVEGQRNVTISAVYNYVDYEYLIKVLRFTLLVVLASLTLAFFTLMLEFLVGKNKAPAQGAVGDDGLYRDDLDGEPLPVPDFDEGPDDRAGEAAGTVPFDDIPFDEEILPSEDDPGEAAPVKRDAVSEAPKRASPDEGAGYRDSKEYGFKEPGDKEPRPREYRSKEPGSQEPGSKELGSKELGSKEPNSKEANTPGLYSPRGNIGWEAYTRERLASELHRCASFEQDLVLIAAAFKHREIPEDAYRRFAGEAAGFFVLRDLIFERGAGGISVIIPNMDLDQAFMKAGEFHERVMKALPELFTAKTDFCLGLSSRSGRLIDAERLLFEASQALKRALKDPVSPIVAFKSDPEKYRAFIASQNKRRP
jgi:hypothetical protein